MANICEAFEEYKMREAHKLLTECGFSRIDTGGGHSAWARFFPNAHVMVSQDATAELEPQYMADCGISVGAFCDETEAQMYGETCHSYAALPRLLLEAFAAAVDYRSESQ